MDNGIDIHVAEVRRVISTRFDGLFVSPSKYAMFTGFSHRMFFSNHKCKNYNDFLISFYINSLKLT